MLREAIRQGRFAITCEFVLGRGKNGAGANAALEFAQDALNSGLPVHAVSLTDNPGGNPAIAPEAPATEILKHGMDVLVHFSCRDLNRNAVESRATALAGAGIDNLLVVTGDYPSSGFEGNAAGVFDLDAVQAVKYLKAMNAGLENRGGAKGDSSRLPPTDFFVGATVSPFKLTEEELLPQLFKLEKKIAAGADFIVTQLGYDMRRFLEVKRYMAVRGIDVPLIGNVYVLSAGAARAMRAGGVPGCVVPESLLAILESELGEADRGKNKRLERAAKMVAMFKGMGFSGVHIGGFALKSRDFRFIIERSMEIESRWEDFIHEVTFARKGEFYAFPPMNEYHPATRDDDPVSRLAKTRITYVYRFALIMHRLVFDRRSPVCRLLTRYYRAIGDRSLLARFSYFNELVLKFLIFGCRDCGDCALPETAYCCPQGRCAKQQRNGPCGGSVNGMCEVYPDERKCLWTVIYKRLKSAGRLDEMRSGYTPPRKAELEHTSGWANYFLGRDHSVRSEASEYINNN